MNIKVYKVYIVLKSHWLLLYHHNYYLINHIYLSISELNINQFSCFNKQ